MEPSVDSFFYSNLFWFVISLLLCALFSFLETSITALRLFKLKEMAQSTKKYKHIFHVLETNPNRILSTLLVAYNLASVMATVFSSEIIASITKALNLSERLGFALGIVFTTTTILIFELIPKNIAISQADGLFSSTLWFTNIIYYLLYPFVTFISRFTDAVTRLIIRKNAIDASDEVVSEKEIQFLIDYINDKGLMERHKTAMLKSIFELGTTQIKTVMVPETSVISININSSQKETLDLFTKYQFTRLPVYEDQPDNIVGMVHQKDFFQVLSKNIDRSLRDIARPIMFVPETAMVLKVLKEFKDQRMHIAMVLNEFGGITGLVTLEDVIEEIVGEISDEYESIPEKVIALQHGGWLVDASITLGELSQLLEIDFETKNVLTLAGFLTEQLQHVPKKDEKLHYKNYYFKVYQASEKRIFQVLIYSENEPVDFEDRIEN